MSPEDDRSVSDLLKKMASKEFYIIQYFPLVKAERFGEKIHEHLLFMIGLEKSGVLFLSGPTYDQSGTVMGCGMSVVRAASFEEAETIGQQDPFVQAGFREAKVRRWVVNEGRITLHADLSDGGGVLV